MSRAWLLAATALVTLAACQQLDRIVEVQTLPLPDREGLLEVAGREVYRYGKVCPPEALQPRHTGYACAGEAVAQVHCNDHPPGGRRDRDRRNTLWFRHSCAGDGCRWVGIGTPSHLAQTPGCVEVHAR